jgi:hypothetical protein
MYGKISIRSKREINIVEGLGMKKFVFIFKEGVCISVEAVSKLNAINKLSADYTRLFESQSFEVVELFAEILDNGEHVRY